MTKQLTGGFEIEISGVAIAVIKAEFLRCGIRGCKVVRDATPTVDAEIVTPVYRQRTFKRQCNASAIHWD